MGDNDKKQPLINEDESNDEIGFEKELENNFKEKNVKKSSIFYEKKANEYRKKIIDISKIIMDKNGELSILKDNLKKTERKWNETYYKRCFCFDCECCKCEDTCDCFKDCWHFFCYPKNKGESDDLKKTEEKIRSKINKVEKLGEYLSSSSDGNQNSINCYFLFMHGIFSFFHFIALSEVHGILLALFEEIERTARRIAGGFYDLGEDKILKHHTFEYFITESNYQDSSQINFNYFTSMFTLFILKSFNIKYKILLLYLLSVVVIASFCFMLLSIDFIDEHRIYINNNYNGWEFAFYLIIPYAFIYVFAGFISLLPHKILDDIYKKENKITVFYYLIVINLILVLSVTYKNYLNYYLIYIFHFHFSYISNHILTETIFFLIFSFFSLLILLLNIDEINEIYLNKKNTNKIDDNNNKNKDIHLKNLNDVFKTKNFIEITDENEDDSNDIKEINSEQNIETQIQSINTQNNIDKNLDINKDLKNQNDSNKINSNNNIINDSMIEDINEISIANNSNNDIDYIGGYLVISSENIKSFIKIKGFWTYIGSILKNRRIILILFINLCSRLQKLKFKTEYKNRITNNHCLFLNYIGSIVIFIVLLAIIYAAFFIKNEGLKCNKCKQMITKFFETFEGKIIWAFLIEFIIILIASLFFIFDKSIDSNKFTIFIYFIIAATGALNFFLYNYYSLQKEEFITLSGIIALSQLIFRILEFCFEPFKDNLDYLWPLISSSLGLLFCIVYLCFFIYFK